MGSMGLILVESFGVIISFFNIHKAKLFAVEICKTYL